VNINYQHPRTGQTALMSASLGGKAKLVKLLLDHGADPTVPEKDGASPSDATPDDCGC
jgi:ankyrin repeat protein